MYRSVVPVRLASSSELIGLESAIAWYRPSLSPIITMTVLHVAPRSFTTFPIKSFSFVSSTCCVVSDRPLLSEPMNLHIGNRIIIIY